MTTSGLYDTLLAQIKGTNAIPNGTYESATTGSLASGSATLARSSTYARQGTYSLKITTANQDSSGVYWLELDGSTRLDISASTIYRMSLWVYATGDAVGTVFQSRVQWYTAANVFVSQVDTVLDALIEGWNFVSVTLTSPATAGRVSPFYVTNGAQGVVDVWVDQAEFSTGIGNALAGGLWYVTPPEGNVTLPYGTMELTHVSAGEYLGDREEVECEVLLYARPWTQLAALQEIADRIDGALLRYVENTTNVLFVRDRSRQVIPAPVSPEDRDLCAVRLVYALTVWPAHLTQY